MTRSEYLKQRYDERRKNRQCIRCGIPLWPTEGTRCQICAEDHADAQLRYVANQPPDYRSRVYKRLRAKYKAEGRCIRCGTVLEEAYDGDRSSCNICNSRRSDPTTFKRMRHTPLRRDR